MIHFAYFPKIEYSNELATNLLVRGKIRDMIQQESALYYPYTVKDEDRADIISTKYYGSPDYTWIIYYANDIHDPVYDWPLTSNLFNNFIKSKYGSLEAAQQKLHHYEISGWEVFVKVNDPNLPLTSIVIDPIQPNIEFIQSKAPAGLVAVSAYDYELKLNESKRNIRIIDKDFVSRIVYEMQRLFK